MVKKKEPGLYLLKNIHEHVSREVDLTRSRSNMSSHDGESTMGANRDRDVSPSDNSRSKYWRKPQKHAEQMEFVKSRDISALKTRGQRARQKNKY
jgi:hypothetical protein